MIEQRPSPDLLVVGGLTVDLIDGELVPGGSVLYATQAAAELGVSVHVLTARGDEEAARAGVGRLRTIAEVEEQPAAATICFVHHGTGQGRRLTLGSAGDAIRLPARSTAGVTPGSPRVIMFAPVADEIDAPLVSFLASRGGGDRRSFLAAGMQGWLRRLRPGAEVEPRALAEIPEPLAREVRRLDLLVASDEDLVIEGADAVERLAALRRWSGPRPELVVTEGVDGAWLDGADAGVLHIPAARRLTGIATVGAGDAFGAVVAVDRARGVTLETAARHAAAAVAELLERRRQAGAGGARR